MSPRRFFCCSLHKFKHLSYIENCLNRGFELRELFRDVFVSNCDIFEVRNTATFCFVYIINSFKKSHFTIVCVPKNNHVELQVLPRKKYLIVQNYDIHEWNAIRKPTSNVKCYAKFTVISKFIKLFF